MRAATETLLELSSDTHYEKMTVEEKIALLSPYVQDILCHDISKFYITKKIDFGMKRGQGKRVGHMVTGGMGSFYGTQTYGGVTFEKYIGCFSENDKVLICQEDDIKRYLKAREFGLGHKMSIAFSKLYYYGRLTAFQKAS